MFKKKLTVADIMDAATADLETVKEQQEAIGDSAECIIREQEVILKTANIEARNADRVIANFRKLFGA